MATTARATVHGVGMITAVGIGAKQTATSVLAGVARLTESRFHDDHFRPIVLGSVADDDLAPLAEALRERAGLSPRAERMLRLAGVALAEAAADVAAPGAVPVFLALPEADAGAPAGPEFLRALALQSGVAFSLETSRTFALGRAGGLVALAAALAAIERGDAAHALVGGADSLCDAGLLERLVGEGRVLAEGVMDGFVPGEGAAFLLLGAAGGKGAGAKAIARLDAVGAADEPGHRYSDEPFHGEGLAAAFRATFANVPTDHPPVKSVHAGMNGESLFSKEWGTAFVRHQARFAQEYAMAHPAECFGDPGAALGVVLVGLASLGLAEGKLDGPCLVWCSSDRETRAAALLSAAGK